MVGQKRLMKTTWYPRPHNKKISYLHGLESNAPSTTIPIVMYDEGLGAISSYKAHPQNASFAEAEEPNCYPDSLLTNMFVELTYELTKDALETDKIHAARCAFMPMFTAFKEDIDAADELTGETIGTLLELQTEATDKQTYPIWNATKISAAFTNSNLLPTNVPGLTTDQRNEEVDFDAEKYYDALQYYTNSGKLKKVQGGLNWFILTRQRPIKKFLIKIRSKVKRMNEYAFLGVMTHCPNVDTFDQINMSGDTTAIGHIKVTIKYRYNEWNEEFDFSRQ